MSASDVHGPIDFVLLEFPGDRPADGAAAAALLDLVDRGVIRLYDLVMVRKEADGSFAGIALDADSGFAVFAGAQSGLLADEDVAEAAEALEPGTIAVLIVYENAWAVPFVGAARAAGGELVASMRIPAQDVMDALEALDAPA